MGHNHLVLGGGNLGHDLFRTLGVINRGDTARFDSCKKWRYPKQSAAELYADKYDVIWCTVGAGSIGEALDNPVRAIDLHVRLAEDLLENYPLAQIIFFSSDYVSHGDENPHYQDPRSFYAETKKWLEDIVWRDYSERAPGMNHATAIRVTSLYGNHRPERTLAGRLRENHPNPPMTVKAPINRITPTPTWWLAEALAKSYRELMHNPDGPIYNAAPEGNVSVVNFARIVLGLDYEYQLTELDEDRPEKCEIGCTLPGIKAPGWDDLWFDERNELQTLSRSVCPA